MTRSTYHSALLATLGFGAWGAALSQTTDATTPPSLPSVTVRARPGADYRVDKVDTLGPLGATPILNVPYTIGVLPQELIENSQARNFKEVSKYLPLVSYQEQQGPQILRPQTRGLQGGNFQNSRQDGMTMYVTVANAMEQYQQIEVVNGLSAFLYGPANPSGMFNFISKRPTDYDLRRINLSYDSKGIATEHADLSGRVDRNGVLSYRLNALTADGSGYVDGSHLHRNLGSLALDLRPRASSTVEFTLSDYHLSQKGYPGWFTYGQNVILPKAPDPTRVGYGQSYAGVDMETRTATLRWKEQINANWRLVAGVLDQDATRDINTPVNNLRNNAGDYTSSFANGFAPRFRVTSDVAYLNGTFRAWGVDHDLTLGTAGYRSRSYAVLTRASAASVLLGNANIANPQVFPEPPGGPPLTTSNFDSSDIYQQGVNVSDTIRFNEAWSTRLALSRDWFRVANYSANGAGLPGDSDGGLSPAASLIYKPARNVSTYVTWASSLQAGDLAPGTAANAGVGLAPYRSKEVEVGVKAALAGLDLAAAAFRIERPFANVSPVDNVFRISGNQVNTGLEFTAVGSLADRLTVYGGVTLLNARLKNTGVAATDGKQFVGAPKVKGNVLLEYAVQSVAGLFANFDWQFSGKRPGNDVNSFDVDGYNLFGVGARYVTHIMGRGATFRLAVDNITDRSYWSTIAPSTITGANTGNMVAHLGSPRTLAAGVSIDF